MKRKIPKELKKLNGTFLPWKGDITLRKPDGPPKGLRLSEPCGACCMLDFFLERGSVVNDGVSLAGHLWADVFIQMILEPNARTEVMVEKVFQWAPKGFSGMDAVVDSSEMGWYWENTASMNEFPYDAHWEIKTTSKDNPKPTLHNREQVIRQRVVMARYYRISDAELMNSYVMIIGKHGKQSARLSGPHLIEPTKEELDKAARDIDLRIQVYEDIVEDGLEEDPYQHPLLKTMRRGSCTRCFPLERAEPDEGLTRVFSRGIDDWEDWISQAKLTKWINSTKEAVKPLVPLGQQVETDYFLIRHTESGRLYIDAKNLS